MENITYSVTFTCDDQEADDLRKHGKDFLRKSKVKCTSKQSYPEAGFGIPAFGVPIEVYFLISSPKGLTMRSTDLLRVCLNLVDEIEHEFATARDVTIENNDSHPLHYICL